MATKNGTPGNDILVGTTSADILNGLAGDDVLTGGTGNDTMTGGDGADTFNVDFGTDTIKDFGLGADVLVVSANATAKATAVANFTASAATSNSGVKATITASGHNIDMSLAGGTKGYTVTNASNGTAVSLTGSNFADVLTGGTSADTLRGGDGNDTLSGGGGNDVLFGGAGNDALTGGGGVDTASYTDATSTVVVNLDNETATGGGGTDTLTSIENVTGSQFNDTLTGNWAANVLDGGAGNDTISGGDGNDTLHGDAGNDTLDGGTGKDTLAGGDDNDTLTGGAGVDILSGDAGDDILVGGLGNDTMTGGAGKDVYVFNAADVVAKQVDTVVADVNDRISFVGVPLKINGVAVTSLTADTVVGTAFDANNDIRFVNGRLQIDLNHSKTFTAGADFDVALSGVDKVIWNADSQQFLFTDAPPPPPLPTLAIYADVIGTHVEDNNGATTAFTFRVLRTGDLTHASSVDYAVTGVADAADFGGSLPHGTINFAADEASKDFTVNVSGDGTFEPDESFTVTLSNVTGATITTADASGTIQNDDVAPPPPPTLSIDTVAPADQYEGNDGVVTTYNYIVTRAGDTSGTSTVNWAISAGDTTNPDDFIAGGTMPGGTLTFLPGDATMPITVNVRGDNTVENSEAFTITLSGAVGATLVERQAGATILNDDVAPVLPTLSISATDAVKLENAGTDFLFTVARSGNLLQASTVDYRVITAGDNPNAGDFYGGIMPRGIVEFASGEASQTITIRVGDDIAVEQNEEFTVIIEAPNNATIVTGSAQGIILNDDVAPPVMSIMSATDKFEGAEGATTTFHFSVFRSNGSGESSATWTVSGDVDAADLVGGVMSGTVNFTDGQLSQFIGINVRGDATFEPNETLTVTLSNPVGATLSGSSSVSNVVVDDDAIVGTAGNDYLVGTIGNDVMQGLAGNDTLIGGDGNDALDGGDGNDLLVGGLGNDTLAGGPGVDTASYADVLTYVNVSLNSVGLQNTVGAGLDTLNTIENLTGTTFNDTLTGNVSANVLDGGSGDDVLFGLDGNDTLIGGLGNDNLIGGLGNDTLNGGEGLGDWATYQGDVRVVVDLSNPGAQVTGEGTDTLIGIENLTGTYLNDTLTGDSHNNYLFGNGGNDVLVGGLGNDILDGSDGIDTVSYANSSVAVRVDLSAGQSIVGGLETDTLYSIENVIGSSSGDTLIGNIASNILTGGAGDDRFVASLGNDTLDGGAGNDFFDYSTITHGSLVGKADTFVATVGDRIDTSTSLEGFMKIGGVSLASMATGSSVVVGSSFVQGSTNVKFSDGHLTVDLNGNGQYDLLQDFDIALSGVNKVTYDATNDYFTLDNAAASLYKIALTFDDGPWSTAAGGELNSTDTIRDILVDHHAKGTFFVIGEQVQQNAALVKSLVTDGMLVENHSWNHISLTGESDGLPHPTEGELWSQFQDTSYAIFNVTGSGLGGTVAEYYRPPYGDHDPLVDSIAAQMTINGQPAPMQPVLWTVDTMDWDINNVSVQDIIDSVLLQAANGGLDDGVVLMHDGGGDRTHTIDALDNIIVGLQGMGYELVTLHGIHNLPVDYNGGTVPNAHYDLVA